jgi:nitroreductase
MTLSQEFHIAEAASHDPDLRAALDRALDAARDPNGGGHTAPWRFYVLDAETSAAVAWLAARRLEPEMGPEGARAAYEQWRAVPGWIVVTCRRTRDPEQTERDREASLTAAQRASLSLWSDNVPSNWVPDLVGSEAATYRLIGLPEAAEEALGVLLYGHPDR